MNTWISILKNPRLSKWLLTVALFFSSLSFSGYVHAKPAQKYVGKTALSLKYAQPGSRRVFFYKDFNHCQDYSACCKPDPNIIVQFNRLVKIKFDYLTSEKFSSPGEAEFFHYTIAHALSEEDYLIS